MKFIITFFFYFFVNCTNKENQQQVKDTTRNIIQINLSKNYLLGKINYPTDTNFIIIDNNMAIKKSYLLKNVYNAYKQMYLAAKKDKINLLILSATRSFYEQKSIWENKWVKYKLLTDSLKALKILEFSSMPGTSRHHWGTDIDLNSLENSYFEKGEGKLIFEWLNKNGSKFGFYQVYTNKKNKNRTGYNQENWHWSYLPIANQFLIYYNQKITLKDIKGFTGFETAKKIDMINKYVNGVNINN